MNYNKLSLWTRWKVLFQAHFLKNYIATEPSSNTWKFWLFWSLVFNLVALIGLSILLTLLSGTVEKYLQNNKYQFEINTNTGILTSNIKDQRLELGEAQIDEQISMSPTVFIDINQDTYSKTDLAEKGSGILITAETVSWLRDPTMPLVTLKHLEWIEKIDQELPEIISNTQIIQAWKQVKTKVLLLILSLSFLILFLGGLIAKLISAFFGTILFYFISLFTHTKGVPFGATYLFILNLGIPMSLLNFFGFINIPFPMFTQLIGFTFIIFMIIKNQQYWRDQETNKNT